MKLDERKTAVARAKESIASRDALDDVEGAMGQITIAINDEDVTNGMKAHLRLMMANHGPLARAVLAYETEVMRLQGECDDLVKRCRVLVDRENRDTWAWQGDGSDHLESLTCSVVIHPSDLKAIIDERDREQAIADKAREWNNNLNWGFDVLALQAQEELLALLDTDDTTQGKSS